MKKQSLQYSFGAFTAFVLLLLSLSSCSSSSQGSYSKTPVDRLIVKLSNVPDYSIILNDMDYVDGKYQHQYKIIEHQLQPRDTMISRLTKMEVVSAEFFKENEPNLGMEIVSKNKGTLSKIASPPGYNTYVNNPQYGQWVDRGGSSFWEFYGKYAMLSSVLNMGRHPVNRGWYNDFDNHRRDRRSYYGPNSSGSNYYGTGSKYSKNGRSTWESKPSSFKDKVRSRVTRSVQSNKKAARVSRSAGKYKNSSMRSRGGSFGK